MAFTCADLSAYFDLQEASGARVDKKSANGLTSVGASPVGNVAGVLEQAALFDGANYLARASTPALTWNGNVPFSLAAWVSLASTTPTTQGLIYKGDTVFFLSNYGYHVNTSGNTIQFIVTDNATHQGVVTSTPTWAVNTPLFLAAWYDLTNLYLSLNDGTPDSTPWTYGSWDDGHHFALGAPANDGGPGIVSAGSWIDEVSIWNGYAFTSGDVTTLYNGGAGYGYDSICVVGPAQFMPGIRSHARSGEFVGVRYV